MASGSSGSIVITRAELARRLGLSRTSVTRACRPGGRLAPAVLRDGVDVLHPATRRWLAERDGVRRAAAVEAAAEAGDGEGGDDESAAGEAAPDRPRAVGAYAGTDLSELEEPLATLTESYGSAEAFAGWVRCRKQLEDARRAEMLRERVAGRLIARTTVVRMVDHVDAGFRQILADAPRSIAARLSAPDLAAATALVRDLLSQILDVAREQMAASLEADDPMAPLMEAAE